MQRLI